MGPKVRGAPRSSRVVGARNTKSADWASVTTTIACPMLVSKIGEPVEVLASRSAGVSPFKTPFKLFSGPSEKSP